MKLLALRRGVILLFASNFSWVAIAGVEFGRY